MNCRYLALPLLAAIGICALTPAARAQDQAKQPDRRPHTAHTAVKPVATAAAEAMNAQGSGAVPHLPIWSFFVESPRDDNAYTGVIVGQDPFNGGRSTAVPTEIVPLVIVTHTIITSIDQSGNITTVPGTVRFDPSAPDNHCLAAPNNNPLKLLQQSPILQPATFDFGGTVFPNTQYVDAFQRASFWRVLGQNRNDYHVTLGPVRTLAPRVIDVPAASSTVIPDSFPPGACGPLGIIDIDWFDNYLDAVVLPSLVKDGVAPSTLPIFLLHNVVMNFPPFNNIGGCCVLGYHSGNGFPIQTYAVGDFDTTGQFTLAAQDTASLSHEIAEWVNDPYGNNPTPPWGNTGQVFGSCQNNLEVGDPLSDSEAPRMFMPNGFTYHLQELAFFSWFYGGRSTAVNGWFSNNGTFLTNAGPPCQSVAGTASSAWIVR